MFGAFPRYDFPLMLEQLIDRIRSHQPAPFEPSMPEASVLVAVTDDVRAPELILTRRALNMNSHAGEVAFPGGKRDEEDTDLLVTALRESEEEIGLARTAVRILGQLAPVRSRAGLKVTPWVGIVPHDVSLTANPHELDAIFHVPIAYFLENPPLHEHRVKWLGSEFLMPSWRYDEQVIWGLTAYIIIDLMNTAYDAGLEVSSPIAHRTFD